MSAADTAAAPSAQRAAHRVEEILDRLAAHGDAAARTAAEELVRALMDYHRAGLARLTALLAERSTGSADLLAPLLEDEAVAALLVLYDLHPEDTETRIARALDAIPGRPAQFVRFDAGSGALLLRSAASSGCGCAGTRQSVRQSAESAVCRLAPEVTAVELEETPQTRSGPALMQIGPRPAGRAAAPGGTEAAQAR